MSVENSKEVFVAKFLNEEKVPDAVKMYLREMNQFSLFSIKEEKEAGKRLVLARENMFAVLTNFRTPENEKLTQIRSCLKNRKSLSVPKRNRRACLSKQKDIFEYIVIFQSSYGMWPKVFDLQTRFKEFFDDEEKENICLISSIRLEDLSLEVKLHQYLTKKIESVDQEKLSFELTRKIFSQLHHEVFSKVFFQAKKPKLWKYWEAKIWEELLQISHLPDDLKTTKVNLLNVENEFMEANLRLVVAIAKKYWHKCDASKIEFGDLIQEGNQGLQKAVRRFDPKLGYKFSTFSTWWIKQAVQRTLDNDSSTIIIPVHVMEKFRKINRVLAKLTRELEHTPSLEEVVDNLPKNMKLTTIEVENILEQCRGVYSLDKKIEILEAENDSVSDFIEDDRALPDETLEVSRLKDVFDEIFNKFLTGREARVMNLRFGRHDQKEHTLAQLGEKLHLSRERIRQIEEAVIIRLRRRMNKTRFLELHR